MIIEFAVFVTPDPLSISFPSQRAAVIVWFRVVV